MTEQTFKQSVLAQLRLPRLQFTADYGGIDPEYQRFLEIEVTEVYGSSVTPQTGDNYLICGTYTLKDHEQVTLFAGVANSTSTGQEAFLTPGSGEFATDILVDEVADRTEPVLVLMIDTDSNAVGIHLRE